MYSIININNDIKLGARNGNINLVKSSLKNPLANPGDNDNEAIKWASQYGHTEIVKLLLNDERVDPSGGYNFPIRIASTNGHIDIVKLLLEDSRVDPSDLDNYAIRNASANGHNDIVKLLLRDPRVDWRVVQDFPAVQNLLNDVKLKNLNYKDEYESLCAKSIIKGKIPPMKLVLLADAMKIQYNKENINWIDLCGKVKIKLESFMIDL